MSEPNRESELAEAKARFENEVGYCDHQCSGNCRRVGCNCKCGEFHAGDIIEQFNSWLESQI